MLTKTFINHQSAHNVETTSKKVDDITNDDQTTTTLKNEDINDIGTDKDTDDDTDEFELHLMCWMTSILFTREASVLSQTPSVSLMKARQQQEHMTAH